VKLKTRILKRFRRRGEYLTPLASIRSNCLMCCCWESAEVARCEIHACPLWPLRFGCHPDVAQKRGKFTIDGQGKPDVPAADSNAGKAPPLARFSNKRQIEGGH